MAVISAANLKYYLSGGVGNVDPNAALGGVRSTTLVGAGLDNLFADVDAAQAVAGSTKYRCIYFRNEDANVSGLLAPLVAWINQQTTATGDDISIGVCTAKGDAATIANEDAAPVLSTLVGSAFSAPLTKAAPGIACPAPLLQNEYLAVWIKRVVNAGAASDANDQCSITIEGDTV
jgi:hypothetical protein